MRRPRPTPSVPDPPDDVNEFTRTMDFATRATSPQVFAERTKGSWSEGGAASSTSSPNGGV